MISFDTEPYFDDYSSIKDFYRILFRPSYAVQARELTQLQTILQNQVSRFGDHVFKNGSQVIPGSVNVDNKVHFVKLEQFTGTVDVTTYLESFKNKVITGETSGVKMRVLDTTEGGAIVDNLEIPTLYCKVEGTAADSETNRLLPGENIIAYAEDNQISSNFRLKEDQLSDISAVVKLTGNLGETATRYTNNESTDVLGYAYSVEVLEGIYYIDGTFVRNDYLKLYVGRFSNTPSCRVGFKITETIVTPEADKTILDNAAGSSNFAAPGAHRYKISLSLVKLPTTATTESIRFVELVRINEGSVQQKVEKASYSELEKTLARRTYDESGNYEVTKFKCSAREHLNTGDNFGVYPPLGDSVAIDGRTYGNSDKFVMVVDPGKAYIQGYEVESTSAQFIELDKARIINGQENNHVLRTAEQTVGLNVGNYVKVNNLFRAPAVDTFEKVYLLKSTRGRPAIITCTISGGVVNGYTIVDGGSGYSGNFSLEILAQTTAGSGATATAVVTNGAVTSVTPGAGGSSYAVAPFVNAAVSSANNLGAPATASDIIGTARVKAVQLESQNTTNPNLSTYKVGLIDIQMFSGYSFERAVKSIVGTGSTGNFACNISPTNVSLIGSASVTANSGSTTITGVGTNFNDSVKVNDIIYLNDTKIGTVTGVNSNLQVTVSSAAASVTGGRISIFTAQLYEPKFETLLFPVGKTNVKTLRGVERISETVIGDTLKSSQVVVRRKWAASNTNGNNRVWFEVTDIDETLLSDGDLSNYLLINNDNGQPVKLDETMITFDDDTNRKIVNFNNIPNGFYYLIASVQQKETAAKEKVKVIHRNTEQTIPGKKIVTNTRVTIQHGDILRLVSVQMTPGNFDTYDQATAVDITDRYNLDNGQRATHYTNGAIELKPGYEPPSGAIKITYDYFSVSSEQGNYNYFSVDSYLTASGVTYEEIPSYYVVDPTTGKKVETPLTDVLDFRPVLTELNSFNPQIPKIGSDMLTPIANYLGRVDKLTLDSTGKFTVLQGVPSPAPKEPSDPKEGIVLATINIPPYTKSVKDIIIKQRENRRYTMSDIGRLEKRISNLEYYVTLSLLEKETASLQVIDATTGLDRFKNGFIVDQFTGHGVGDVKNQDYRVAVSPEDRTLRPMFTQEALELVEVLSSGTDRSYKSYKKTNDLITLPYTESNYIYNHNATREMDIHAISMGSFKGQITLLPEGDNWKSVERRPDLVRVDDNNYDAIKFMAEELGVTGTKWNEWQTNWTSIVTTVTDPTENRWFDKIDDTWGDWLNVVGYQNEFTDYSGYNWRDGINTSLTSSVNTQDYGDRIIDMSYIPFIRQRPVTVIGQNLKGKTKFYPFFDGIAVDQYMVPADKFTVTRVGNYNMSFDQDMLNRNVKADTVERSYAGRIEQAFSVGDVLENNNPVVVNISSINNLTSSGTTFSLVVSDATNIKPGHHVMFYNMDYHNARTDKNLNDLHENQIIPASTGLTNNAASSKELNLRKFKVVSVSGNTVVLGNIDGSSISAFSAYSTASYSGSYGKLLRLKASAVVVFAGVVSSSDSYGPLVQDLYCVNIKNGFAVGETLTGMVTIGSTTAINGVTLTAVNDSNSTSTAPTMKTFGDSIITDVNGTCVGVFHIPETAEMSFRTGERTFKLTDSKSNGNASFDSIGSSVYYAQGISLAKERTIVSTRTVQFVQAATYEDTQSLPPVRRTTTNTRLLYQYAYDPLAQTFTVSSPGGCLVTGIDLYFSVSGNRPVTVELRNTDNGVPSSKVIPFSQVTLPASSLKVSSDSSLATTFNFKSPIYLQDTETYCFVVMTDEPGTQLYVSEMGGTDILTGNTIAGQPLTGSLYASQNAKEWEIHPLMDMKFALKKATFSTTTEAEVVFRTNAPQHYRLPNNPFIITPNTNKIRIYAPGHGFVADEVALISGVPDGFYGANSTTVGIPSNLLNTTHVVLQEGLERDSFVINLVSTDAQSHNLLSGTNANFIKGEYGGDQVYCSKSIPMDVLFFKNSDVVLPGTKIQYYISTQNESKSFTDYVPFIPNSNYFFQERMHISSFENQVTESETPLVKKPSMYIKAVMSSENPNISPIIDIQQLSAFAIANQINDKVAENINIAAIDSRKVLGAGDLAGSDISITGTGTITCATNSTTVTGSATTFSTQVFAGNVLKNSSGTTIGTVSSVTNNGTLVLTSNAAVAVSGGSYYVYSTPNLTFENVTYNNKTVGQIRTNIDTADNLLATIGIGKTIVISNAHVNVDGTYVVHDTQVVEDKTTYSGNTEQDTIKVVLNRSFTAGATIDMLTDNDFAITVYDKFVDDVAPFGCHNAANYITRTLSLSSAADNLKVLFDANIVNNSSIKVYYRAWTGNVDLRKVPFLDTGFVSQGYDPLGNYIERSIEINNLPTFNNVQIKIVFKSKNPVYVPKIKNLRLLALS